MRVLLVDDDTLVRKGLSHLLATCVEGAEVTEAGNAEEALDQVQRATPDVALVDIRLPRRDGLDLLRELRSRWPGVPVIMLTGCDDPEYVKAALAEGAAGYLLKDSTPEDLTQAITVALTGSGSVLSPRAVRNLFERTTQAARTEGASGRRDFGLTPRESDILRLLPQGQSNRDISRALFLSEKTVKAHLAAVFRKLGVTNRTKAAMMAVQMGLAEQGAGEGAGAPAGATSGVGPHRPGPAVAAPGVRR